MQTVGIICEYNPFHNGHRSQLMQIREDFGEDTGIVCLMSGNYVQRGEPAIFSKALRAEAAVRCGADLVLELPLTAALSSAEGFASRGVEILTAFGCEGLSFGSECGDRNILMLTAEKNLDPRFDELVRQHLTGGCSYPSARALALSELGGTAVSEPNDILAVEYCKAILKQGSPLRPLPIRRPGDYHATELDRENPSATAIRAAIERDCRDELFWSGIRKECDVAKTNTEDGCTTAYRHGLSLRRRLEASAWLSAVPACLRNLYANTPVHTVAAGERAVLAILRTLPDEAFAALPFGAEGLWSKLMKNCRACASVEEIIEATKSKRYTRTRIQRMLFCAFLGLTAADLQRRPPYVRVLAFNDRGRALLRTGREGLTLVNAGETPPDAGFFALESRAADLYSLFSEAPGPGGAENRLRVCYYGK